MIQMTNPEEGFTRVVDADNLQHLTGQGWVLLAVLEAEAIEQVDEPIPFAEIQQEAMKRASAYGQAPTACTWRKPVVLKTQRFLVRQLKESTLASVTADLGRAREESTAAHRLKYEFAVALKDAEEKLAQRDADLEKAKGNFKRLDDAHDRAQSRAHKLELDIAKLRTALGDLRMKEILEGET